MKRIKVKVISPMFVALLILGILYLVFDRYQLSRVSGNSMYPAVKDREVVVVQKKKQPQRYDLIAFEQNDHLLIKRVIGLPGDQFIRSGDRLWVGNGDTAFDFSYTITVSPQIADILPLSGMIQEGEYFVVGDALKTSRDSRTFGFVSTEDVFGKVLTFF
ncbi:signal peptidase I [Enterococcus casseliflavus]|uniref:signal peptidase I n=1 Tax=Enterococcus casseliflavus TaxID=37734 RepID=UPI003D6A5DE7